MERNGSTLRAVEYGLIQTPRVETAIRLQMIHDQVGEIVRNHAPDALALERLLFAANKTTALDVAKAIGVILLTGTEAGLQTVEFPPPEIKLSVVGNGAAEKRQVQFMVTKLLGLSETPKPDDVADALAVAITFALRGQASYVGRG